MSKKIIGEWHKCPTPSDMPCPAIKNVASTPKAACCVTQKNFGLGKPTPPPPPNGSEEFHKIASCGRRFSGMFFTQKRQGKNTMLHGMVQVRLEQTENVRILSQMISSRLERFPPHESTWRNGERASVWPKTHRNTPNFDANDLCIYFSPE